MNQLLKGILLLPIIVSLNVLAENDQHYEIDQSLQSIEETSCKNQLSVAMFAQNAIYSSSSSSESIRITARKRITKCRNVFDKTSSYCEAYQALISFKEDV